MSLTLAIIKPDSVEARNVGLILAILEREDFRIRGARLLRLDEAEAGEFYAVHRERPFFEALKAFMTSGPVLVLALERDDAVLHLRKVIGATDPAEAEPGTVRALYAENKERNGIHASDSDANAALELAFFFSTRDLIGSS
jgi:nucleoside-diphosphate kinase